MADYRDHYEEIRAAGADVVAISVDTPAQSEGLRRQLALPFVLLSDRDRSVIRSWNVLNARERGGIAKPSVFVIDRDMSVRFCSVDGVVRRVMPRHVLPALQQLVPARPARHAYIPRFTDLANAATNQFQLWRT